ncbi:MAG: hypothetical protein Q7T55_15400, partial [Solirubrobacteraceae bacterium]|nr:hypothetical protein [Solirubrobacteraceae bacterium]
MTPFYAITNEPGSAPRGRCHPKAGGPGGRHGGPGRFAGGGRFGGHHDHPDRPGGGPFGGGPGWGG